MAHSERIPVNVVFSPSWWHARYGICFREPFYLDSEERIRNDVRMRQALQERFGLGEVNPLPRPVIGSRHIAGGFVVPALLRVEIRFAEDQPAWPMPRNLGRDEALALRAPELSTAWPTNLLLAQMDELAGRFGYVTGDLNTGGLINTAVELRGQQFFIDLVEDAELCEHLLGVIAETQARVAELVKASTGTCAVATNRSVLDADPALYLTSNCSAQMISPALYEKRVQPFERRLADRLRPFGIHHCGHNLHRYIKAYAPAAATFFDVGWGSDVAQCSREMAEAFLNLRLSPVRLMQSTANEVYLDALGLLRAAGRTQKVGLCCINMDRDTPDENVLAIFQAARDYAA